MSQVYFDANTNEYFYYGGNGNVDVNNVSDDNIKPVPNASIKRGSNSYRRESNSIEYNGDSNEGDPTTTNKSLRDVKSKYPRKSTKRNQEEEETDSEEEESDYSTSSSGDSSSDSESSFSSSE